MGTIIERKRADGSSKFRAQIVIKQSGKIVYQTSRTFDRRPTAKAWLERKEKELKAPGGLDAVSTPAVTLGEAIDRYTKENRNGIGDTKAQVLRTIKNEYEISAKRSNEITSDDIVDLAKQISDRPGVSSASTVGNYISHLSAIFDIAFPAWKIPLDEKAMRDAMKVCKRLGLIASSKKRDRRPELDELDALLSYFEDRHLNGRSLPMHKIVTFAIFSTRRESEITRISWTDFEKNNSRALVRDMKHPGKKAGNDIWCELPPEAVRVIDSMGQKDGVDRIFPYHPDTICNSFTNACKFLGIKDLRFHDLRHEGVSRLFEMGRTIPQVASVSGHKSWQGLQRYSHLRATGDKYEGWPWLDRIVPAKEADANEG
ncbi:site-specific integrase [Leisingera sp.]|uniref:site-specific integrase n=1 Tax=Leisingera sp. TaxID=1879318 RepID=UPI002B27969F|nr:site-specific integrase [Leisingera sp.]